MHSEKSRSQIMTEVLLLCVWVYSVDACIKRGKNIAHTKWQSFHCVVQLHDCNRGVIFFDLSLRSLLALGGRAEMKCPLFHLLINSFPFLQLKRSKC